jgi:hypothetical protein
MPLALCHLGRPILAFASHCAARKRTDGPSDAGECARSVRSLGRPDHIFEWELFTRRFVCRSVGSTDASALCAKVVQLKIYWPLFQCNLLSRAALLYFIYIYGWSVARSWRREVVFVTKDVRWWPKAEPLPCCKKVVLLLVRDVRLCCILLRCSGFLTLLMYDCHLQTARVLFAICEVLRNKLLEFIRLKKWEINVGRKVELEQVSNPILSSLKK